MIYAIRIYMKDSKRGELWDWRDKKQVTMNMVTEGHMRI